MAQRHISDTMAALAIASTPAHLRTAQLFTGSTGPVPVPAAGGAPQRAAPVAAATIDWSAIVAEENSKLGIRAGVTSTRGER